MIFNQLCISLQHKQCIQMNSYTSLQLCAMRLSNRIGHKTNRAVHCLVQTEVVQLFYGVFLLEFSKILQSFSFQLIVKRQLRIYLLSTRALLLELCVSFGLLKVCQCPAQIKLSLCFQLFLIISEKSLNKQLFFDVLCNNKCKSPNQIP